MENKRNEIVLSALPSVVAGFVDEDGKLPHDAVSLKTKMPGGSPGP